MEFNEQLACGGECFPDQQPSNKENNFERQDPELLQIKEEQDEIWTRQEIEQFIQNQEIEVLTVASTDEEFEYREPKPNREQLLCLTSALTENQDEEGSPGVDSGSAESEELAPKKRRLETGSHHEDAPDTQVKEEKEELCISQEQEHFGLKQEDDTFIYDGNNSETGLNHDQHFCTNAPATDSQDQQAGVQNYLINPLAFEEQQNPNYSSLTGDQKCLSSGWVSQISHTPQDDEHIVLNGPVEFSRSINGYRNADLILRKKDGKVVGVTWNQTTWKNVMPDTTENIHGPDHGPLREMKVKSKTFDTDADVIKHFTSPELGGLAMIPGTILHHVVTAKLEKKANANDLPKNHGQCVKHKCELCRLVFERYVKCGKGDREKIETKTKGQNNQFRLMQKKIRITCSELSEIPKKADPSSWVRRKLNCKFVGSTVSTCDHPSESSARKCFERTTGCTVETKGLIVHKTENWLVASISGIIDSDTILQIKCPTPKKLAAYNGSLLKLIESNEYDVKLMNGQYVLTEPVSGLSYYYLVQVAMCCANRTKCKFFVWTPDEHVIVDVPYDQEWTREKIFHLKEVYFEHLLPSIATRIAHRKMKVHPLQ
ncbi:uncharacterized protein KZ484_000756 [Pholidichthys leucotaenia]